jgi:Histidine kinase-, DNA gyrase B-, and HSP90-like ATPase
MIVDSVIYLISLLQFLEVFLLVVISHKLSSNCKFVSEFHFHSWSSICPILSASSKISRTSLFAQQTSSTVQVTIINSSQAIPIGDRDRIFERFYRGDSAHTHKIVGIGLGLNLAREIVRAHHGELVLNSTSDGETSFTVSLPIV